MLIPADELIAAPLIVVPAVLTTECLNVIYRQWRRISGLRDGFEFTLAFNISAKQARNGFLRLPMKLMDETSRRLAVFQTLAAFFVFFHRDAANLFEQIGLTVDHEQGLKLAKITEFFSGSAFARTDQSELRQLIAATIQ